MTELLRLLIRDQVLHSLALRYLHGGLLPLGRNKGKKSSKPRRNFLSLTQAKGVPLEEIAKLFDGEDANVGGNAKTSRAMDHLRDMKERGLTAETELTVEGKDTEGGGVTRHVEENHVN